MTPGVRGRGARSVSVRSVQLALALAILGGATTARADETVAIVDARATDAGPRAASRADLTLALRTAGLEPLADLARAAALTGDDDTTDGALADGALAATRERFGALDCAGVREPGQRAVQLLAGREAAGQDERVRLRAAWSYLLLCADRDGARVPAQGFADRLRTLGGSPAIPAEVWARYPEIDAGSELALTTLTIPGHDGAEVWVDHRRVGVAPLAVAVATGGHVLAMARGAERVGLVLVTGEAGAIEIAVGLTSYAGADGALAAQVRRWQAGAPVRPAEMATLLDALGLRVAIVLEGEQQATVWARSSPTATPAVVFTGDLAQPQRVADGVRDRVLAWARGPEPERLITESDLDLAGAPRGHKKLTPWWVYAAIGGAAVAGAVTIWALGAGEKRQRIELTFP